jgi:hypothetical protein
MLAAVSRDPILDRFGAASNDLYGDRVERATHMPIPITMSPYRKRQQRSKRRLALLKPLRRL